MFFRGKKFIPFGEGFRNPDGLLVFPIALRAALEEIEIFPVVREFDVHRHAEGLLEDFHDFLHLPDEARVLDESGELDDHIVAPRIIQGGIRLTKRRPVVNGQDPLPEREFGSDLAEDLVDGVGFETPAFHVDDVDESLGVIDGFLRHHGHMDARLAGADENGIIVFHPVDGPRPQSRNHSQQAVLASKAGRPAELVVTERHSGQGRKEEPADAPSHDALDQDPHFLVVIQKAALGSVLNGVGTEDRRIDLSHGLRQRRQSLLLGPRIGQEKAPVFSRKGSSQAVLEKARGADDERAFPGVVQNEAELAVHLGRLDGMLEDLLEVGIIVPYLFDPGELQALKVLEKIVMDEIEKAIGRDEPRLGNKEIADGRVLFRFPPENLGGRPPCRPPSLPAFRSPGSVPRHG